MFKKVLLLSLALSGASLWGQQSSDAVVLGSVTDASQAAISGATVTVTSVATAAVTKVQTDGQGEYRTPPLRIGEYRVSVEAAGFKQFSESSVRLSIGDVRKIDATLQVGHVTESVTISDSDSVLNTSDSTQGAVVGESLIQELPLTTQNSGATNGRDYLQLALLSAGTAPAVSGVSIGGQQGSNRYADSVVGGWSIDPIFTLSSGLPFNLTVTGNPSNTGTDLGGSNDRPNIVGNYDAAINPSTNTATHTKAQWFNTAAFAANSPYTFGDAGRNILRGDGAINLDLSAHKRITITEGVNAQLRLEAFNIANHDVLAAPNAAVGSSTFGQVTSASSTARELQAAIKVSF